MWATNGENAPSIIRRPGYAQLLGLGALRQPPSVLNGPASARIYKPTNQSTVCLSMLRSGVAGSNGLETVTCAFLDKDKDTSSRVQNNIAVNNGVSSPRKRYHLMHRTFRLGMYRGQALVSLFVLGSDPACWSTYHITDKGWC